MKKLILLIVSLVYLGTTTGAGIHLHYCMNKYTGWDLDYTYSNASSCDNCGMAKGIGQDNRCCKDQHILVKNTSDQKNVEAGMLLMQAPAVTTISSLFVPVQAGYASLAKIKPVSNAPPRTGNIPVYLLNRLFRI